jgi:hypothetical protein
MIRYDPRKIHEKNRQTTNTLISISGRTRSTHVRNGNDVTLLLMKAGVTKKKYLTRRKMHPVSTRTRRDVAIKRNPITNFNFS